MSGEVLRRWIGYAAAYLGSTGLVQLLGAITTFAYVRFLPVGEYGKLSLALTTIAFIALMSDLGLTGALNFYKRESSRSGPSFEKMAGVIRYLRIRFFLVAAVLGSVSIFWSLYQAESTLMSIIMLIGLIAVTALIQLNLSLNQAFIRLMGNLHQSYRIDIAGAVSRLGFAMLILFLAPQQAGFALLSILAGTGVAFWLSKAPTGDAASPTEWTDVKQIIRFILPMAPSVVLLAAQEMIIYYTAWWLGGASPVASVFALGRISALLTILGGFFNIVVVSKLANVSSTRRALLGGYGFVGILAVVCSTAIVFAWSYPDFILLLIGPNYAHLQTPLLLSFCSASLMMLAQAVGQLNRIVGWVRGEPFAAMLQLAAIISAVSFFDMAEPVGVLQLWVTINAVYLLLNILTTLIGVCAPQLLSLRSQAPVDV